MSTQYASLERLVSQDPGGRGIGALVRPDHLRKAAVSLRQAGHVVIVSGFAVAPSGRGETDGPPGALALGNALSSLGARVTYLTDTPNAPLFEALGARPLRVVAVADVGDDEQGWARGLVSELAPTHLVAVERVGRSGDGVCRDMRGEAVSSLAVSFDALFNEASDRGLATVGIGDGGNEIGMGLVRAQVGASARHGEAIACVTVTEHLIVAGVSNWGAWGVVGALSILSGRDLLPSVDQVGSEIETLVNAGAVDGVTLVQEVSVDGLSLECNLSAFKDIRTLVQEAMDAPRSEH